METRLSKLQATTLFTGSILMGLAVLIGAFGAHAIRPHLDDYHIGIFRTGNQYHFYHALAILALTPVISLLPKSSAKWIIALLTLGVLFFSGSLYLLACRELLSIQSWTFLGPMTPIGGLFFLIAWVLVSAFGFRILTKKP